jgi:hypothetical protein
MPNPRTPARSRWTIPGAAVLALGLLPVVLAAGGCTSDPENSVGSPLVETVFDTVLAPVQIEQVDKYSAIKVVNQDIPVHRQEIVYLGSDQGVSSSILANFDFSFTETSLDTFTRDYFVLENIKTVQLSLIKPRPYHAIEDSCYVVERPGLPDTTECVPVPTGRPRELHYLVRQLEEPFSPLDYVDYPNEVPPVREVEINSDVNDPNESNEPFIRIYPDVFAQWAAAGLPIGLLITLDPQSEFDLIGYASRELKRVSEFDQLQVGTAVGANFRIEFNNTDHVFLMDNYADTSTFDAVPEPPADVADGIVVQSGLRSFPTLFFDFGALPANARINRAVIDLTLDNASSLGPIEDLAASEIDTLEFGDPFRTITMAKLREPEFLFLLAGWRGLDPETSAGLELEVTTAVQRYINRVTEGTKGIMISTWEFPPLSGGSRGTGSILPPVDYYFQRFNFFGTAAAADQRPKLRVTYTLVDELGEGGD